MRKPLPSDRLTSIKYGSFSYWAIVVDVNLLLKAALAINHQQSELQQKHLLEIPPHQSSLQGPIIPQAFEVWQYYLCGILSLTLILYQQSHPRSNALCFMTCGIHVSSCQKSKRTAFGSILCSKNGLYIACRKVVNDHISYASTSICP